MFSDVVLNMFKSQPEPDRSGSASTEATAVTTTGFDGAAEKGFLNRTSSSPAKQTETNPTPDDEAYNPMESSIEGGVEYTNMRWW